MKQFRHETPQIKLPNHTLLQIKDSFLIITKLKVPKIARSILYLKPLLQLKMVDIILYISTLTFNA